MSIQAVSRRSSRFGRTAILTTAYKIRKTWREHKYVYLMLLPVVAYYAVFHYGPMYGAVIAFKDFSPASGIWGSPWVGLDHFREFFNSYYFWRLIRNTLLINVYSLIFGFPVPIIFALLLNELTSERFKRVVQTATYLPHFISVVVVVGMILTFTGRDGPINGFLSALGFQPIAFMSSPEWFRTIYVGSEIWQGFGWGSIIYLAALSNIDPNLYEAAKMDGASRWGLVRHVTLPGIAPIIIITLILQIGRMMTVGFEKLILMYNPLIYETADVISTFIYRRGLLQMDFSYSAAIGLFDAVVNFSLLTVFNAICRRKAETSLW